LFFISRDLIHVQRNVVESKNRLDVFAGAMTYPTILSLSLYV